MPLLILLLFLAATAADKPDFGPKFLPSQQDNMNGNYASSTTAGGHEGSFPIPFRDYPGGVESYDVFSPPITTLYSQVWWAPLAPVDLPAEMVKKYANGSMAIVGWEIDQVQLTANGERSVPISASYNHHYVAQIIGAGSNFEKVMLSGPDDPLAAQVHARVRTCASVRFVANHCVHACVRSSCITARLHGTSHTILRGERNSSRAQTGESTARRCTGSLLGTL
jgi:hypothetical protein